MLRNKSIITNIKKYTYTQVNHIKFIKNQNVKLFRNNNDVIVTCFQNSSTPGIRMNNIMIQSGTYIFDINIETCDIQLILWIYDIKNNIERRIILSNGINKIEITFDNNVQIHTGILFQTPIINAQFIISEFSINEKEIIIQNINVNDDKYSIENIEHTYVINLDNRVDRLFKVERYLHKINILFERISGVIPTFEEYCNIKSGNSQITSIGALGCIESHIKILKNAIENNYETILILEDDIVPMKMFDFKKINIPKKWDILYLGCSQYNYKSCQLQHFDNYYIAKKSRGTFAYVIKKHMFKILLELFCKLEKNVDMYLEEIQEKYECYVIYENAFITDLTNSDISISRDIDEYGDIFGWKNSKYYASVSIILPILNGEKYLCECLESIKNQTYTDFEIIIINDGSTDNTQKILTEFFNNNLELTITYINHEINMGLPKSLNDGLKNSHGKYITWILHNDIFKNNAIEMMYNFLEYNNKFNIVIGGYENIVMDAITNKFIPTTKIYGIEYTNDNIILNFHKVISFMFCKDVVKKIGYYDEKLVGIEDYDYLIRILELIPHKNGVIHDILCQFCIYSNQLSNKYEYEQLTKKMLNNRQQRLNNDKINITTKIIETINKTKDTMIYPPIVYYDILYHRPQQILKCMTKYYNCIFITKDEKYEKICDGVIVISWNKFIELRDYIVVNNVLLYYTDPRAILYTKDKNINPNIIIFDLINNPVGEFECWREKLSEAIDSANLVTYSSKFLENIIYDFMQNENKNENKNKLLYLTNCCDINIKQFIDNAKQIDKPTDIPNDIPNDKKIIGYYGTINSRLDYDIIKTIANNSKIHVVMIGNMEKNQKYNMKFEHKNITWLEHKKYNELFKYLNLFDICLIPFLDNEMVKGCNPIKLYEFLESGKPVLSTIKFIDYNNDYYIVDKNTVNTVIDRLLFPKNNFIEISYVKQSIVPYWNDVCNKLFDKIISIKRQNISKRKKCAYVTDMLVDWITLKPRYGGSERYALNIAKLLKENWIDVDFYQMAEKNCDTVYYNFPVHCINIKCLETYQEFYIGYSKQVNDIIKKEKYDYVIYGMPEICCSENILQNSISINHGIWFDRESIIKDTKWYSYMETHIKYPCINVSVDTNFINFIRAIYPKYGNKLNYIPNFYDQTEYQYVEKNNDKIIIVIPKRATIYHGTRIMEEILNLINHDVDIIWVGKGDIEDNKILKNLMHYDRRFKFIGCSFEDMKKYYNIADIVVIPTIASEGTSLSCIEAMASGCAVVSTNVGGLCNLIVDGYNGIIVNPNSYDIANAINTLIINEELRKKLIHNALQIVNQYTIDNWKKKWIEIFIKMGWIICDNEKRNNYFVRICRDDINKNFNIFWKNYVHYHELHQTIKTYDSAYEHFQNNKKFEEIYVCNPSIKIAVFTRHAENGSVETIIAEEAKHFNMDIYVANGIQDKNAPFLYNVVYDVNDILKIINLYDIIIYHWIPEFVLRAIKMSKKHAIEYLHEIDTDDNDKTTPIHIVTHSSFLINHCRIKFNKICSLIEHPINIIKFHPKHSCESYIGCFCTYNTNKGIDILISSLQNIKYSISLDEWNQYKIVFFGKNQQKYREYLEQLAYDKGVNCEFRDSVNTWEHINKYKLFIIPSKCEGLPIVLLEAIACNIPIITSNLEGIKEFYDIAKRRGYDNLFQMFNNEDKNDLTQKIFEWFKKPFTNPNGYEYIKKYYSLTTHCNNFMNIINPFVNKYQKATEKIICSEIKNYETYIVNMIKNNMKIIYCIKNVEISHDIFMQNIINIDETTEKIKQIEVILNVKNVKEPIYVDYKLDIISDIGTSYKSDIILISMSGIKSLCSPELNLISKKKLNINIRPNNGNLIIDGVQIMVYY